MFAIVRKVAVSALVLGAAFGVIQAHEGRTIDETYDIAFGWRVEPAFQGQLNGADFYISLHDTEATIEEQQATLEALVVDLQVDVTFGDQTITQTLEPKFPMFTVFDGVGYVNYVTNLVPTLPGDYVFRVYGTVDGMDVDEIFDSADGEFSTIEPASDLLFPAVPDSAQQIADLEARIATLEALVEELTGQ
jgi:hypothetical protein